MLVDEKTLWPDGKFVTTNIIVRTEFLEQHPDVVKAFLEGHVAALTLIENDPAAAKADVNAGLQTPDRLEPGRRRPRLRPGSRSTFTADPLPATLVESAEHAVDVGLLEQSGIDAAGGLPGTLYDLTRSTRSLTAGRPAAGRHRHDA